MSPIRQIFLLNLIATRQFPIFDQHVYHAYCFITDRVIVETIQETPSAGATPICPYAICNLRPWFLKWLTGKPMYSSFIIAFLCSFQDWIFSNSSFSDRFRCVVIT